MQKIYGYVNGEPKNYAELCKLNTYGKYATAKIIGGVFYITIKED